MSKEIQAGYHIKEIQKGQLGEQSKIYEEALELQDAIEQDCRIMQLVEMSDLVGAVEYFAIKHDVLDIENFKNLLNSLTYARVDFDNSEIGHLLQTIEKYPEDKDSITLENWMSKILLSLHYFLNKYHSGYTLEDLYKMSKITERAFVNGRRG